MKLIRFGSPDMEFPGVLTPDGKRLDVRAFGSDFDEKFFATQGLERLQAWLSGEGANSPEVAGEVRWASPIARPSKIICVGLNYADHARESNMTPPAEPVLFFKSTTAIAGPFDEIIIPWGSQKTDWEVELAVVIGKKASYISEEAAFDHVAGYMLHNDVSERAFQLERSGQWVKGKSCDSFAPLGPFMATRDEIADPHNLRLWLKVNGETMQDGNTSNFIFNLPQVISYISQFMTLLPGDVISTGTPAGVAMGMNPPRYLRPGDVVALGIEGLGSARQSVIACP